LTVTSRDPIVSANVVMHATGDKPTMLIRLAIVAGACALTIGCAGPPKRNPPPIDVALEAQIPGLRGARFTSDENAMDPERVEALRVVEGLEEFKEVWSAPNRYLAISGGGPLGAFGAGLLVGWTDRGDRPEFQYVTGISTGALTAPFAFLGPDYDHVLEEVYTTFRTDDLVETRSILGALTSESFATTKGLASLLENYLDDAAIDRIAAEHLRGRRLYVGTTNLDLMEPTYWNIGMIAASDLPNRYELVRKILLASASIPGAFPPQIFEVEVDGETYDELHVDGGAATQVFAYPLTISLNDLFEAYDMQVNDPRVYIIRNAKLHSEPAVVQRTLFSIAGRSVSALIKTQGIGDLFRIYIGSIRDGVDFNLAYIPADFDEESTEQFDPIYMRKLFDRGREMARNGYPWDKQPPDFAWPDIERVQEIIDERQAGSAP
jgi:predicted acylesterase/phospholipase RssA